MKRTFDYDYKTKLSGRPVQAAINFMLQLDKIVEERKPAEPATPSLLDVFAQRLLDGGVNPELAFGALHARLVQNEGEGFSMTRENSEQLFMAVVIAALHAAIAALLASNADDAYDHLMDATKMEGLLHGYMLTGKRALVRSELAKKAGAAGKPLYKEKKRKLHAWYLENLASLRKLSLERAAIEAMKTDIGISLRTAQNYIKEFRINE